MGPVRGVDGWKLVSVNSSPNALFATARFLPFRLSRYSVAPIFRSAGWKFPAWFFRLRAITCDSGDYGDQITCHPPVRPRSSPVVPGVSRPRPDGYPGLIPRLSRSVPSDLSASSAYSTVKAVAAALPFRLRRFRAIPAIYKGQAQPANCQLLFAQ